MRKTNAVKLTSDFHRELSSVAESLGLTRYQLLEAVARPGLEAIKREGSFTMPPRTWQMRS